MEAHFVRLLLCKILGNLGGLRGRSIDINSESLRHVLKTGFLGRGFLCPIGFDAKDFAPLTRFFVNYNGSGALAFYPLIPFQSCYCIFFHL